MIGKGVVMAYHPMLRIALHAIENVQDIGYWARNGSRKAELTPEFIDGLYQERETTSEAFHQRAMTQYGNDMFVNIPTEEGQKRISDRVTMRYDGLTGRLTRLAESNPKAIEPLPEKTKGYLASFFIDHALVEGIREAEAEIRRIDERLREMGYRF